MIFFYRELPRKLIAGGLAGIVGTTLIYPIDMAKTLIQTSHQTGLRSNLDILKRNWAAYGMRGYYRGLSANLIGVTPEKAIKLTVNDLTRRQFSKQLGLKESKDLPVVYGMLAGGFAGTCQVMATTPMEMVKINMQLRPELSLGSSIRALGLRGLYTGVGATLMRDIPFSMMFFQLFATISSKTSEPGWKPSIPMVIFAGCSAGAIAAVVATPMDLVKTRYQSLAYASQLGQTSPPSINAIWREAFKSEGISGLFKGSLQRCFIVGPLFGVSLLVFELQNRLLPSAY